MSRASFEAQYRETWRRLDEGLEPAHHRRRSGRRSSSAAALPELYRQTCHHLALARHRRYGADLEERLNNLVLHAHQVLYRRSGPRLEEIGTFLAGGFSRRVRRDARWMIAATLLFALPFVVMALVVPEFPDLARSVVTDEALDQAAESFGPQGDLEAGRSASSDVMMFGFYIYNNISIAFRTFASGILFGLGSLFFLVYNGLALGAVAGHVEAAGNSSRFLPFVAGHSSFELTAIVISGAAGLKLGISLLKRGRRGRLRALKEAALETLPLIYGAAVMLVAAAFIEAFWSASALTTPKLKLWVGGVFWLGLLAYLLLAGRRRRGHVLGS